MRTPWLPALLVALPLAAAGCPSDADDDSATDDDDTTAAPPVSYECGAPQRLPEPVNSTSSEMGPSLSPDGLTLYFSSSRDGGAGSADIWLAHRDAPGEPWTDVVNLGAPVNGTGGQTNPTVSPDDRHLVYGGNRNGNYDLWFHDRAGDGWGPGYCPGVLVSDMLENKPAYSWDGERLYFKRSDPTLVADIWVSEWAGDGWGAPARVDELDDDRAQTDPAPTPEGDVLFFVQGADTEAPYDVYYAVWDGDAWGWIRELPGVSVTGAKDEGVYVGPDGREFFLVSNRDDPDDKDLYTFTCERVES